MRIADDLSPYWDKIAQANEKLYSWLGDKIVSWVSNIDVDAVGVKLDSFIKELDKFANAIGYIAKGIGATVEFLTLGIYKTWKFNPKRGQYFVNGEFLQVMQQMRTQTGLIRQRQRRLIMMKSKIL